MRRIFFLLLSLASGFALVLGILFIFPTLSAKASDLPQTSQVVENGLAYLRSQQGSDGGILGFSGTSDPDTTARSMLAFILAGQPVSEVISADGNSMLDYLATQAISFTHDNTGTLFPGRAGLLLAAISLSENEPTIFGGMNMIAELQASFQPETGAFSTTAQQEFSSGQASDLSQAWALLGLSLAGEKIPDEANQFLIQAQAEDGSWGFGDPDTTALAMIALLASEKVNQKEQAIQSALQFFHANQLASGGWRPTWDTDPLNADSTGWILQALFSAGEDPTGEDWSVEQANPVQALMGLQKPDGSIGGTYANPYSTAEAIIGLAGVQLTDRKISPVLNQAGLVIFASEGRVYTACVSFREETISGLDLLQRSGLSIDTAHNPNQGTAVCKIEGVGCPSKACFCKMPDYWSYWIKSDEKWAYSTAGAEQSQVGAGEVNAWSWGTGNPPADVNFQNLCEGVPFVIPTATVTAIPPTDTPIPTQMIPSVQAEIAATPPQTIVDTSRSVGTYIVYGSILIVLGIFIFYLLWSRRQK